jgi:hypothetical protein
MFRVDLPSLTDTEPASYLPDLWAPATGQQTGAPLTGHTGPAYVVAAVSMADGRT